MGDPDIPLVFPPSSPAPDTHDFDDDKENGKLSDNGTTESKKNSKNPRRQEESDSEIISDSLYVLDDGAGISVDLENDESFKKFQQAVGIEETLFDLTLNIVENPNESRSPGTCFNCGATHTLAQCSLPRDPRRISKNRVLFDTIPPA